ncbi:MAG: sugar ABC transporter substrate-binding protein [Chloroflexota bacterium]
MTYAFWDANQQPAVEKQIAAFEASHPGIKVEPQVTPWADYWTKLQTSLGGGAGFDVFWSNGPNFPVYASQGAFEPLDVDASAYPKSLVDLYTYNGKLYGAPKDFDTIAMFYNKSLFDKAGVAYPTADWTWDDLRTAAKKLTITSGGQTSQWGFAATPASQSVFLNLIYQNGGSVFNADGTKSMLAEPAACEALKFLYSIQQDGSSPSAADQQANSWDLTQLFGSGKIAMYFGGSWMVKPFHEASPSIDVAPLPKGKQRASIIHGLGQVVWSGGTHKDTAKQFVAFLATKEAQEILANESAVIPAMNGLQKKWVESVPSMNLKVFLDAVDYSVPFPVTKKGPEWIGAAETALQDVWLGTVPADQLCQHVAEAVDAALAK